jgi:uncharacterized protein YjbI with pentapeptide repeats
VNVSLKVLAGCALVVAALLWLAWCWWVLPGRISLRYKPFEENQGRCASIEDSYRRAIAQAIGGVALISALCFTALQYRLSSQIEETDQYQKAFEALKGDDVATHVGGIYWLQKIMQERPEWRRSILAALSAAAVVFSRPKDAKPDHITQDANAALQSVAWAPPDPDGEADLTSKPHPKPKGEEDSGRARAAAAAQLIGKHYQLAHGWFVGVDMHAAFLEDADLESANLSGADFFEANLRQADLALSTLSGASFVSARMEGVRLVGADLNPGKNFSTPSLQTGSEIGTQIPSAHLDNANMTGAKMNYVNLQGATMTNAVMVKAQLEHACMDAKTSLRGANLAEANMNLAWLGGADFGRANPAIPTNLKGAQFRGANLAGTRFGGADLDGADFTGANLQGAVFTGASMKDAVFSHARFCRTVMTDGKVNAADTDTCAIEWPDMAVEYLTCDNQIQQTHPLGHPYMYLRAVLAPAGTPSSASAATRLR